MKLFPKIITIDEYYKSYSGLPLIDVRSPGEYTKGHIPNAYSISLFSDEERAVVGTAYTRQSKEIAVNIGLKFVKPKLQSFIDVSKKIATSNKVVVHCWRGGMRSAAFAEHLSENGIAEVYVIKGGYKAFRNYVLQFFEQDFKLSIIGGYTGSGKTRILELLADNDCQIVDLEGIAHHRGSAFGGINMGVQPSVEQFETNLFEQMRSLDLNREIWMEDESHSIGAVAIPLSLFKQMKDQTTYFLDIPREERARYLVQEYSSLDKEALAYSIEKIQKRLGYDQAKLALEYLEQGDFYSVAMCTLKYYDKFYLKGLAKHNQEKVQTISLSNTNHEENTRALLKAIINE